MRILKYYIPFILTAIILLVMVCCTVKKNTQKTDTKEQITSDTQLNGIKTTDEYADTSKQVGASVTQVETELDQILNGDSSVTDTPDEKIVNKVVNGKLKTEVITNPKVIPFKFHKKTTEVFKGDQKINADIQVKEKDKQVERTGINLNYLWWLLLLLIIPIIKYRRYFT